MKDGNTAFQGPPLSTTASNKNIHADQPTRRLTNFAGMALLDQGLTLPRLSLTVGDDIGPRRAAKAKVPGASVMMTTMLTLPSRVTSTRVKCSYYPRAQGASL